MSDQLFDRAVRDWLDDGSDRTPPTAIEAVLLAVKTTPQERALRIPRRFNQMPTYMRPAAAIAIVAVVGVGAIAYLGRGSGSGGSPTLPPTPIPTVTAPVSLTPTPPPIGQRFTSTIHAIALSYPDGWVTRKATKPWTTHDIPYFQDDDVDVMYDPALTDHLFLGVSSQSHAGTTREAWANALAAGHDEGCEIEPMEWDGGSAWIARSCRLFLVAESDIGWAIRLYTSGFPPAFDPAYDRLFDEILDTVDIHAPPAGG